MDFGKISRQNEEIQPDEWRDIIKSVEFLQPIPDREGVNPFTQEKVVFLGEGKAHYVENGENAGSLSLEEGELFTTGVPKSTCEEIAKQLNAQVLEDDRS